MADRGVPCAGGGGLAGAGARPGGRGGMGAVYRGLDTMLERSAVHQERELDSILQALVSLLGPLMILVMGGLVLLIVLAMLLPIFELNQLVK